MSKPLYDESNNPVWDDVEETLLVRANEFIEEHQDTGYNSDVWAAKLEESARAGFELAAQYYASQHHPVFVDLRRWIKEKVDSLGKQERQRIKSGLRVSVDEYNFTVSQQVALESVLDYIDEKIHQYTTGQQAISGHKQ